MFSLEGTALLLLMHRDKCHINHIGLPDWCSSLIFISITKQMTPYRHSLRYEWNRDMDFQTRTIDRMPTWLRIKSWKAIVGNANSREQWLSFNWCWGAMRFNFSHTLNEEQQSWKGWVSTHYRNLKFSNYELGISF